MSVVSTTDHRTTLIWKQHPCGLEPAERSAASPDMEQGGFCSGPPAQLAASKTVGQMAGRNAWMEASQENHSGNK